MQQTQLAKEDKNQTEVKSRTLLRKKKELRIPSAAELFKIE